MVHGKTALTPSERYASSASMSASVSASTSMASSVALASTSKASISSVTQLGGVMSSDVSTTGWGIRLPSEAASHLLKYAVTSSSTTLLERKNFDLVTKTSIGT